MPNNQIYKHFFSLRIKVGSGFQEKKSDSLPWSKVCWKGPGKRSRIWIKTIRERNETQQKRRKTTLMEM